MSRKVKVFLILLLIFILVILMVLIGDRQKKVAEKERQEKIYNSLNIEFVENKEIEYGSQIKAIDFIKDYTDDALITLPELDSHKLGVQKLSYKLKIENIEKTFDYEITVKDNQKPIIEVIKNNITIEFNEKYDLLSNIKAVFDVVDGSLKYSDKLENGTYIIETDFDNQKPKTYEIVIKAQDLNGNISQASYAITVNKKYVVEEDIVEEVKPTYIKGILLVNKKYAIDKNFGGFNSETHNAYLKLKDAAAQAGYNITVFSGYRSYQTQQDIYNWNLKNKGKEYTEKSVALPGHSEHQTGLAYDVGRLDENYGDTPEGKWLAENCANFGFIIRYPKGKEHITGYKYEAWHIRYVGKEHAIKIMEQNLALEEYLGVQ